MTKSELIAVVAVRTELNKTQAEKAVNAVIAQVHGRGSVPCNGRLEQNNRK